MLLHVGRMFGTLGLVAGVLAGPLAGPSLAQYPPAATACRVSANVVPPGASITVTCGGFRARTVVRIILRSTPREIGTAITDGAGSLTQAVTIPADTELGAHELVMSGESASGGVREVSVPLTVVASRSGVDVLESRTNAGRGGGELSRTGSSHTVPLGAAAVGLVGLGTASLVIARRRHSPS